MAHEGMVHALREVRRVLKPNGLLLDLRPGPVHRRIGLAVEGRYEQLAVMSESLDDDHAANRAVAEVIKRGWFKPVSRAQVNCDRVMALKDFEPWVSDFRSGRRVSPGKLIEIVTRAYRSQEGRKSIVAKGPLVLKVLRKVK